MIETDNRFAGPIRLKKYLWCPLDFKHVDR